MCGNTTEPRDASRGPGKSSLFFLTALHPQGRTMESDYPEIWFDGWQSAVVSTASGAPLMALENRGETIIFESSRTHNRIRSPR